MCRINESILQGEEVSPDCKEGMSRLKGGNPRPEGTSRVQGGHVPTERREPPHRQGIPRFTRDEPTNV